MAVQIFIPNDSCQRFYKWVSSPTHHAPLTLLASFLRRCLPCRLIRWQTKKELVCLCELFGVSVGLVVTVSGKVKTFWYFLDPLHFLHELLSISTNQMSQLQNWSHSHNFLSPHSLSLSCLCQTLSLLTWCILYWIQGLMFTREMSH